MAGAKDDQSDRAGEQGARGLGAAAAAPPRADVLVVEDDPEINELIGAYAQLAGFDYRAAHSGGAALDEVRRRRPSVIVLDVMLPDLDGFEVCSRVRRDDARHEIPLIILTALAGERPRQQGRLCGADEFITKPFDPDTLIETISRHAHGAPPSGNGKAE